MELWIRNQDRENLVKVGLLEINERENDYAILTIYENRTANLGLYKSKERALEILDEIQDFLSGREAMEKMNKLGGNMNNIFPTMIYIMPEE